MSDEQAERDRLELIDTLFEAATLLRAYAVTQWPETLEHSRSLIENRDFRGVEELYSIFGGMSSFNDIVIHPFNGNPVAEADIDLINEQFRSMQSKIYSLVMTLRRYTYAR